MAKSSEQRTHDKLYEPVAKREVILGRTFMEIEGKDICAKLVLRHESADFDQHEFANLDLGAFVNPFDSKLADTFLDYRNPASLWESFLSSEPKSAFTLSNIVPHRASPRDQEELRAMLFDNALDSETRIEAFYALNDHDPAFATQHVIQQLSLECLDDEWRNSLVLAAEVIQFIDPDERSILAGCLRKIAHLLRESEELGIEPVLWSAMRRHTSLIASEEVAGLLEFLDVSSQVDTRLITLLCIVQKFALSPPTPTEQALLDPLCERIAQIANKFLDPDVFSPGENAAIVEAATHALSVMVNGYVGDLLHDICQLNIQWLVRQILHDLTSTLEAWSESQIEKCQAFLQLQECIDTLECCSQQTAMHD